MRQHLDAVSSSSPSLQERHLGAGETPEKGNGAGEEDGGQVLWGAAEGGGAASSGEKESPSLEEFKKMTGHGSWYYS